MYRQGTKCVRCICIYIDIIVAYRVRISLKKWSHTIVLQSTNTVGSGACGVEIEGEGEAGKQASPSPPSIAMIQLEI